MARGLLLSGTARDTATLALLAQEHPQLAHAPWTIFSTEAGTVLSTAGLTELPGLELVDAPDEPQRQAPSLVEAVPPIQVPGDPVAEEALFLLQPQAESARALLQRLLRLECDGVELADLQTSDGARRLLVRVPRPPLYTLMRARDQPADQTTVFAPAGPALWIEWSWSHPLAWLANGPDQLTLVDRHGRWLRAPPWSGRSLYSALDPELEGRRIDLQPAPEESRFVIRLRLGAGPEHPPEAWLLDPDQFFRLEAFIDAATSEEVRRITVARQERGDGRPIYLLQERVQPGKARIGTRISELLGIPGFAKNSGTDNLFIQTGRRLLPLLERAELRRMLDLDAHKLVLIDEDTDGPRVFSVRELDAVPLSRWVDYVATDRRMELDRLLERTVFSFPPLDVAQPARSAKAMPAVPPPQPPPRVVGSRPRRPAESSPELVQATPSLDELAEVRAQARALEAQIVVGGCDDPGLWQALSRLHLALGDVDEACQCMEAALFYGRFPKSPRLTGGLVKARTRDPQELMDLAVREVLGPRDAALMVALFVDAVVAGRPLMDDLVQAVLERLSDPGLPIGRRIAWVGLAAWHHAAQDALGATRAREALLGVINERGLSEIYDLPRFVRYALALEDDDRGTLAHRARAEQLDALERLFEAHFANLPELDSMACFVRSIFAVGFMRLGAADRARTLVEAVEHELVAHDAPNQVLFRLLISRMTFETSDADDPAWRSEVEQILSGADRAGRRPAAWLAKRSIWLGTPDERPTPQLRPMIDRMLSAARKQLGPRGAIITRLCRDRVYRLHDWERAAVIQSVVKSALASGKDKNVVSALDAAEAELEEITILSHRIVAIGVCIRGAATLEDERRIEQLVERILQVTRSENVPWVRDLLVSVRPCLMILRRLGASRMAQRLLEGLEAVPVRTKIEQSLLTTTLASGYLQLDAPVEADALMARTIDLIFDEELDYVSRFEAGALAVDALRHWPTQARTERYQQLLARLEHFRDLFTTSQHFKTHQVLILERIVDAMADSETRQSDRVQSFLDLEEHAVRTKILADWKNLCGR